LSPDLEDSAVTLGRQLRRPELPTTGARWCEAALPEGSVYRFLARERARLFPPELFADLFEATGRRSVPPSILAVVMVLQRLEGLSDREAADRFAFDVRWRYAAGVADAVAGEETASFAHTVLVDLRARLRRSEDPDRIFRVTCDLARQVGLVGVKRVLDSAPLEDAVTTQDTVTLVRGAIRGLLRACPPALEVKVRGLLRREDDYRSPGKPACDWQDRAARQELVDALVRDGYRAHYALRGERLEERVAEAAALLATVTGQDIEETPDGRFRIFEGTAPDRVISTVDPQARHGHKTAAHGFDGYKGHLAVDPDSEVICAAEVSPAATGDAAVAPRLLEDLVQAKASRPPRRWSMATALMAPAPPGLAGGPRADADDHHPAADRARRPVRQRPVPRRPPGPDGHLPGPGSGGDHPSPSRWWRAGPVRRRLQPLPAARCLHHQRSGSSGRDQSARGRANRGPCPPARSRMAGRLPSDPAQGGAQARPPAAPPPRWPPRPGPRAGARGPGLEAPGRSDQPGPLRHPRAALNHQRLAATAGLTAATGPGQLPGNRYLNAQNTYNSSENTGHLRC